MGLKRRTTNGIGFVEYISAKIQPISSGKTFFENQHAPIFARVIQQINVTANQQENEKQPRN